MAATRRPPATRPPHGHYLFCFIFHCMISWFLILLSKPTPRTRSNTFHWRGILAVTIILTLHTRIARRSQKKKKSNKISRVSRAATHFNIKIETPLIPFLNLMKSWGLGDAEVQRGTHTKNATKNSNAKKKESQSIGKEKKKTRRPGLCARSSFNRFFVLFLKARFRWP